MASSGPNNPSASSSTAFGTQLWSNISDTYTSNDSRAAFNSKPGGGTADSYRLNVTGFGFSIPAGTIDGILVEIERRADRSDASNGAFDHTVQLIIGGTVTGSNKADTVNRWPDFDTYKSYGGASDLWGLTPTVSEINSSDFGVSLIGTITNVFSMSAYVDHIRVTVYYTAGGGSNPKCVTRGIMLSGPMRRVVL